MEAQGQVNLTVEKLEDVIEKKLSEVQTSIKALEGGVTREDLEDVIEEKLSKVWTSIKALEGRFDNLEGRFDNLEKGQRDLKESVRFLEQRVGEGQNLTDKKIEKLQRRLNSRIDNIHAASSVPVYPHSPRSAYVAEGKPDTANYVSNDMIEPLPKFYR